MAALKKTAPRPAGCHYCINNKEAIDYKDVPMLRKFLSSYGKIMPRRRSGLCAMHQRKFATAVKRARVMALIPFESR